MPRTRRFIESGKPYELILRVKAGLPFRPGRLVNALIEGIIARAQRDKKVTICHYVWMGNHVHIILVTQDPQSCVDFYQEIQKKLTDAFKRLLGQHRLSMWEGDAVLAQILDLDKAIDRVAYLYANPSRANLVDSIGEYPGVTSFKAFMGADTLNYEYTVDVPWLRLPWLKRLKALFLSQHDEHQYLAQILPKDAQCFPLVLQPNAWMEAFKVGLDEDVASVNQGIIERLGEKELEARIKRKSQGKRTPSKINLFKERIFAPHTPSKRERRIYVLSNCKKLRVAFVSAVKEFCARCSLCYQMLKEGIENIPWPSQAFRPAAPPLPRLN